MSRALKGRKRSPETCAKISRAKRQRSVTKRVLAAVEKVLREQTEVDGPDDRLRLTGFFPATGKKAGAGSSQSPEFSYSVKLREYRRSASGALANPPFLLRCMDVGDRACDSFFQQLCVRFTDHNRVEDKQKRLLHTLVA